MQPAKKMSPAVKALIVIVLIGAVIATVIVINNNKNTSPTPAADTTSNPSTSTDTTNTPSDSEASTGVYKDGTYTETGSYSTPGGRESIGVTVTLKDSVITSTTMTQNARTGEAREYQSDFESGYKSLVVGKNIDAVSLSRVAGSSLTSNGFNAAIDQIKTDAKA